MNIAETGGQKKRTERIGLVSDTHGRFNPNLFSLFSGVDLILHAGDVGDSDVIRSLQVMAPLVAVQGNTDYTGLGLAHSRVLDLGATRLLLIHQEGHVARVQQPPPNPADPGGSLPTVLIHGHSHRPQAAMVRGKRERGNWNIWLKINPGSAGAPRFGLPVTAGILELEQGAKLKNFIFRL